MNTPNPYVHWGINNTLLSWPEGQRRQQALADGLRRLAAANGIKFREPLQIDSNGEFSLAVSNGTDRDGPQDGCGEFGEVIAELVNKSGGARTGIHPTKHMGANNGWCRLEHFAAQSILEKVKP